MLLKLKKLFELHHLYTMKNNLLMAKNKAINYLPYKSNQLKKEYNNLLYNFFISLFDLFVMIFVYLIRFEIK